MESGRLVGGGPFLMGSHVANGCDNAPCPSAPLLQREGQWVCQAAFWAESWPGIQALGGARPVGTMDSLASLVFSDWPISKHVSGTSFGSDLYSQLVRHVTPSASQVGLGKLDD